MNHFMDTAQNAKDLTSILSLLDIKTQWLLRLHTVNNIDDIDGFALQIINKCLTSLKTLSTICTLCKDYPSANTVLRMVIDSISVYNIVYATSDAEERAVFASNMSSSIPIALIISDSTLLFFIGSPP